MTTKDPNVVDYQSFLLKGGLDQVSPTLSLPAGMCRDAINFECNVMGGYSRISGFERYDGRPKPSEQAYWTLNIAISGALAVGDTVTGATSAATGVVVYLDAAAIPGTTVLVITKLTGSFTAAGEDLKVAGVTVAHSSTAEARRDAVTPKLDVFYLAKAANIYRQDVQKVPGSGPVLGVWMYNDVVYAFRNNAGGTAALMYKGTSTGWVLVTTPALLPGGKYEFVTANFGGTTALKKMFGCDSVNKAFMFDGTTFTQITTGMALDKPIHIEVHKNFLWLTFDASLQHSAIGDPTTWSVVVGAGEIALGDTINSIKTYIGNSSYIGSSASNAMLIHTNGSTQILYGASNADFSLSKHSDTAGGVAGSVQIIDQPYYLSDLGIVNLTVTQAYGNFEATSLSQAINPFIIQERSRVSSSCLVRAKSQYRLFFNDGFGLHVSFINGKVLGMMPVNYGVAMRGVCSQKNSGNDELIFAGSDAGYVYQLEKGTSFDGQPILAYMNLAFASFKSPRNRKRWRKAALEVRGSGYLEYAVSFDLSWANPDVAPTPGYTASAALSQSFWDQFTWDQFFWDGVNNAPTEIPLDGTGENIGLKVYSNSDAFAPFNVASAIIHFSMRRQMR